MVRMSDKDTIIDMFERNDILYKVLEVDNGYSIVIESIVIGCSEFYTEMWFDKDGNLLDIGVVK